MADFDFKSLGIVSAAQAKHSAHARVLVIGKAKIGKTVALAGTAPKPLVLNADGQSATKPALTIHGDRFWEMPYGSRAQIRAGLKAAKKAVEAGAIETIIVDSLTSVAFKLEKELEQGPAALEGFDLWREYRKYLEMAALELFELPAHVFLVGHIKPGDDRAEGDLPGISGSAKTRIPGMIDDWVMFDYNRTRKPHDRAFLVGPQPGWGESGRNVRDAQIVEATVPALLKALGLV